jgi:carboxynorspermidine decarboxylase
MSPEFERLPSPIFIMHEERLVSNLEKMAYVQEKAGVKIILALKGFSMYSTFPIVSQYLLGSTASSLHEAKLGHEEFGGETHVYSPAYREDEFDELMTYADYYSFNSLNQFQKFSPRLFAKKPAAKAGLRINPEYSTVTTDLYNPCIPGSRLGIRAEDLPENLPDGISFFHSHNLCESDSFALEETLKSIEKLFGKYLPKLKKLNLGGGHLMTKEGYDIDHLINTLLAFKKRHSHLELILEPGSAVAWQTGYLSSTVLDIVSSKGINVAILDCSISAHMPDVIEMPYKPKVLNASDAVIGKPTYRLGGQTCLAGDFVGDYSFEKPLNIGDKVVFDDMMHYTMVKTTTFNGINLPHIGIWRRNNEFELVKSFGYSDFKSRL